jgi:hypothetical protein
VLHGFNRIETSLAITGFIRLLDKTLLGTNAVGLKSPHGLYQTVYPFFLYLLLHFFFVIAICKSSIWRNDSQSSNIASIDFRLKLNTTELRARE